MGASVDGKPVLGSSGSSTVLDVNVRPDAATPSGDNLAVDLLSGDGKAVNVALPTSTAKVQETLAPVGSLVGAIAGKPVGNAVVNLTNGLSPTVATVTATVDGVVSPVLDGVNGVLEPVVGEGGVLAPVTDLVGGLTGNLPVGGADGARSFNGPLLGVAAGDSVITGPSTTDTLAGVNLLSGSNATQGQLVTANVLTKDAVLDVALPTTAQGVQAGLAPVGNLVGSVLGEQAGAGVDQLTGALAPVVAPVAGTVDSLLGATTGAGGALAPVTGVVNQVLGGVGGGAPDSGAGGPLAPVTGVVGSVLGGLGGGGSAGGPLAPVTGIVGSVLGGVGGGAPAAGSPLAPVQGLLGGLLGGLGN